MITIEQCRAARGLLGWTQSDLAQKSGLSKTAINNFEKGHSDIKYDSLIAIQSAFTMHHIEFLKHNGVRKQTEKVSLVRHDNSLGEIFSDIMTSAHGIQPDILLINMFDPENEQWCSMLYKHLAELDTQNIRYRTLSEYTLNLPGHTALQISHKSALASGSCIIYGNKVAVRPWKDDVFFIAESPDIAAKEREKFGVLWRLAQSAKSDPKKRTA